MMEITPPPFNFTMLALLVSFIFFLVKLSRGSKLPPKLPPTPLRLPVIGNLHQLVGGNPHRVLARLAKKYGPIMHLQLGEVSAVVLSSPETAKEALKVQDPICADRPGSIGTNIMWQDDFVFCNYNDYWRQARKICVVEMLSVKNVKSFESIRKDEVIRLVKSIRASPAGEPINLTKKIFTYSSSMTSRVTMGKVANDNDVLIDMLKEANAMAGGFELADLFPSSKLLNLLCLNKYKLVRMKAKLDRILDGIIEEHKVKKSGEFGGEDVVDVLLRVQKDGEFQFPFTSSHVKGIIYDLFAGGTETSSTTMDWAMTELMRSPHAMEKAQSEVREALKGKTTLEESDLQGLTYLNLVIKETLRLHPPASLIPRVTRDECKIDGYSILAKTKVVVNAWSLGRDPNYWQQPEAFLPERFENSSIDYNGNNFEYIPFGAGRRMCPGINFGISNLVLPLSQLLYHFDWKMPQGMTVNDIDMTERDGFSISRMHNLLLVPVPYNAPVAVK